MKPHTNAFTLIELSIVLVIVALIAGGVMVGQSLIRSSEINSVATEFQAYRNAMGTFKDKYDALPGDMINAVSLWGAQTGATTDGMDAACAALNVAATGTLTCNGDGDGFVVDYSSGWAITWSAYESYRFWQHLSNAGMIEGSYTGVTGSLMGVGSYASIPGTNVPSSRLPSGGWSVTGLLNLHAAGDVDFFPAKYGNILSFFGTGIASDWGGGPIIKAEEALAIDTKLDDGKPNSGNILSYRNGYRPHCVTVADDAYFVGDTTQAACTLFFITGY